MNNAALQFILGKNVVELTFVRRHHRAEYSDIRGLLGTTNPEILNGDFGGQVLNFRPPKGIGMGYDYTKYGLCVVWDMFRQGYRVFGSEQVNIRQQWDVSTPEAIEEFKTYFYEHLFTYTEQQKMDFMGYVGQYNIIQNPKISPETKKSVTTYIADKFSSFMGRMKRFFGR